MSLKNLLHIFVILSLLNLVLCFPDGMNCFNLECPAGTVSCKKVTKTNIDKTQLEVAITCLDPSNGILKEHFSYQPNPYDASTTYESTSYSGTYNSRNHGSNNIIHRNINLNFNNELA